MCVSSIALRGKERRAEAEQHLSTQEEEEPVHRLNIRFLSVNELIIGKMCVCLCVCQIVCLRENARRYNRERLRRSST